MRLQDFYALSKRNDYIKVKAIAQNIAFEEQKLPMVPLKSPSICQKPEKRS